LIAHLCASLGWEWEAVEDLTMPRLRAFSDYFEEHPPLHMVVAAFAGVKPRPRGGEQAGAGTMAAFESLLANSVGGHPGASDGRS
jgi:hypothetical protein